MMVQEEEISEEEEASEERDDFEELQDFQSLLMPAARESAARRLNGGGGGNVTAMAKIGNQKESNDNNGNSNGYTKIFSKMLSHFYAFLGLLKFSVDSEPITKEFPHLYPNFPSLMKTFWRWQPGKTAATAQIQHQQIYADL
jgi:hypothetical protein